MLVTIIAATTFVLGPIRDRTRLATEPATIPESAVAPPAALVPAPALSPPSATVDEPLANPPIDVAPGTGLFIPVSGVLPAELRDVFTESRSNGRVHEAIDIMAPQGTPVLSAAAGTVLKLHRSVLGGLMVYAADEADRFILMYGHLDAYAPGLAAGAAIGRGQLLGYVGTTGNVPADAPHLHFAISRGKPSEKWWSGTPVNPFPLLAGGLSLDAAP